MGGLFCIKKVGAKRTLLRRGAGGRTRTGTVSPPVDFESTTSANSITPANKFANKSITNYIPFRFESQDLCESFCGTAEHNNSLTNRDGTIII